MGCIYSSKSHIRKILAWLTKTEKEICTACYCQTSWSGFQGVDFTGVQLHSKLSNRLCKDAFCIAAITQDCQQISIRILFLSSQQTQVGFQPCVWCVGKLPKLEGHSSICKIIDWVSGNNIVPCGEGRSWLSFGDDGRHSDFEHEPQCKWLLPAAVHPQKAGPY